MLADSDPRGYLPLREALAGHLRLARGVRVEPAQLFIVQSTQQAVHLAARVLCDPGERAWIEDPHYVGALVALRAAGVRPVPVPVDDDGMDVAWAARRAAPARLAYVTPAHQAPLGVTMTLPRRLALLEHAARAGMVVFEDDYDSEFRHEGHPVPALQAHDRNGVVVHSGSFSKTLFPGLRLGYLVVPAPLVDAFIAARSIEDRYSPVLAQAALADFIGEGHFARHLRRMRQLYRARRAALLEALAAEVGDRLVPIGAPAGLELVVRFGEAAGTADVDDVAVEAALAARGVQVQALSTLSLRRRRPPRGLVLGFAAVPERRLRAAVAVLAEVLR
jgi:GntR family transcriptional regulator/MocR family aminotransferase